MRDVRASSLLYVFNQLKLLNVGAQASGYEYVPQRKRLTTQQRRRARKVLREQLRASLALLEAERISS